MEAADTVQGGCSRDDADAYDTVVVVVAHSRRRTGHAVDQKDVVTFRDSCPVAFQT